ncbi:MAG: phosphatase PAP2 family protein [Elusimicrobiota bacterium]|jgi:hypothetical protein|nr:phosphatase PAP2 family protein [Elusimicrobiota bacterium]
MKKIILSALILFCSYAVVWADIAKEKRDDIVPLSMVFYQFGHNTLGSFTYNYGLNYAVAAIGTYGFIESGIDWQWNRLAYNNRGLEYAGYPSGAIGMLVPLTVPIYIYVSGRNKKDTRLQTLGLAVAQAEILALGIHSAMKAVTGRRAPGIIDRDPQQTDYSDDFKWGLFERGIGWGWPSGHTSNAVAAATVIAEFYKDNFKIKAAAYGYAAFIGIGMSFGGHWLSDVFAGALVGYAIGKTVSKSFLEQYEGKTEEKAETFSFYCTLNSAGIVVRF